jgi:hypothetical protein
MHADAVAQVQQLQQQLDAAKSNDANVRAHMAAMQSDYDVQITQVCFIQ